jgi:Raf kinase inhibitor-like YbhB/YbcL family protein
MAHAQHHDARRTPNATGLVGEVNRLTSPSFADGSTIPTRHTADGENVSPPLTWTGAPEGTESFVLVCEDPDAPSGTFVHWLVAGIPATCRELREGLHRVDLVEGENGFGELGWGGPSPPPGAPHRYVFRLYALDTTPTLEAGARRPDFDRAIEGHVLHEAVLIGMYGRTSRA